MLTSTDLFELPPRLRNLIYSLVLHSDTRTAPRSFQADPYHRRHEPGKKHEIRCELQPAPNASYGLLGSNRQIRAEMRKAIDYEKVRSGITYKLDCMFYNNTLVPTWTSIPTCPKHVQHLDINIRPFGPNGRPYLMNDSMLFARLAKLLSQFLLHGPQFTHDRQMDSPLPCLDSVTFKFDTMSMAGNLSGSNCMEVCECLHRLAGDGLLFGKVRTLWLHCGNIIERTDVNNTGRRSMDLGYWAEFGWVFGFKHNWMYEAQACCDGIGWQTS